MLTRAPLRRLLDQLGRALAEPAAATAAAVGTSRALPGAAAGRLPAAAAAAGPLDGGAQRRGFFRVIDAYERGVMFTLGRQTSVKPDGLCLCVPLVQRLVRVDMRLRSHDIREQHLLTADNVSIHVDAVIFMRIADARKAVCEVDDPVRVAAELAQAHLRDALSHATLEQILHRRGELSQQICDCVAARAVPLGIEVQDIKLKNISVDPSMVRALAKKAEAEREGQARAIHAAAEVASAARLGEAARALEAAPGGMRLRELQTYLAIAREPGTTVLLPHSLGALVGTSGRG